MDWTNFKWKRFKVIQPSGDTHVDDKGLPIVFDTLKEAKAWIEKKLKDEGLDWQVGWYFKTRESNFEFEVVHKDGRKIKKYFSETD